MRYSKRAFPAYRFIPGKTPHPTRDPDGHSYGRDEARIDTFGEHNWRETEAYLYGVDLFNYEYWWEAHEAWEGCWLAAGRRSEIGCFVQGLIQISVACLKRHQGFEHVALQMTREGLDKFPRGKPICLGIVIVQFRRAVEAYFFDDDGALPRIELDRAQ
jgi:hypothetical protein